MRALEVENPRRCTKIESLQQPANKAKSFGLGLGEGALRSRISGKGLALCALTCLGHQLTFLMLSLLGGGSEEVHQSILT